MDKKLNILMFSGEYDKALAALILANTARQMDVDVTMFFAFWGLSLLKNDEKINFEGKSFYEKLFHVMMPNGAEELPLSKMNFSGIGKTMMIEMMENQETPKLIDFLDGARKKGVKFYGCKLSMEIMGIDKDELIPELEIMDAQQYLENALKADMQLFI